MFLFYFVNIASGLGLATNAVYKENLPVYDVEELLCLENVVLDTYEVKNIALKIDISKASCIRQVNSKICKDLLMFIPERFCKLFNTSLSRASFPQLWSTGYVNLIPKGGDLNNPGN